MEKPAARSRARSGIPRIEPVPTAPAPPIWKADFGRVPQARATSSSVRRRPPAAGPGRRVPRRPQNGGSQRASQASPSTAARAQRSGAHAMPRATRKARGSEKAKSIPTTRLGSCPARSTRRSPTASRSSPCQRCTSSCGPASAAQIFRRAPVRAPDQSMAMMRKSASALTAPRPRRATRRAGRPTLPAPRRVRVARGAGRGQTPTHRGWNGALAWRRGRGVTRKPSLAQVANQVTFVLKGHLKNVQLSYLRAAALLARVRDERLWKALAFPDIETYAQRRLRLGRAALYRYLQVHDWVRARHPEWLGRRPKGFIPELSDAFAAMWIDERLAEGHLSDALRAELERMRRKALDGSLTAREFAALRRRGKAAAPSLRLFLRTLRSVRKRAERVPGVPREVLEALDLAVQRCARAVGAAQGVIRLAGQGQRLSS